MHAPEANPKLVFQAYGSRSEHAINSISRGGLNLALVHAAARHENVSLHFDRRCVDVDVASATAVFVREDGSEERVAADLVIGADGAFSAVRGALQKTDRFEYSQNYLEAGYKELHIPAVAGGGGPHGGFALDPNALHIWPRGSAMMIALPNPDKSFTCTLFWPFEMLTGLTTREQVDRFFQAHYPDAVPLMPTLVDDYLANPVGSLVTVRCWPWARHSERGTVAVLGDAAHAIVPFYGQGMNAAFEDVARAGGVSGGEGRRHSRGDGRVPAAPQAERRRDRANGAGELRRDARQGGEQIVSVEEEVRARGAGGCAGHVSVAL
ncbi:MAG: FAD-dependent monooxygenase [Phycisphaerales bacterium]